MFKYLLNLLFALLFAAFFTACGRIPDTSENRAETLATLLQTIDKNIPFEEALSLSREIFQQTDQLRKQFNPVSEPHVNNFLVNIGLKEKGLCYEWSDPLYIYFRRKSYRYFSFHLLVANRGKYFQEHNVLAVTSKKDDIPNAVIIDPWREPGTVYFSKVKDDKKYVWEHRFKRGCQKGR